VVRRQSAEEKGGKRLAEKKRENIKKIKNPPRILQTSGFSVGERGESEVKDSPALERNPAGRRSAAGGRE